MHGARRGCIVHPPAKAAHEENCMEEVLERAESFYFAVAVTFAVVAIANVAYVVAGLAGLVAFVAVLAVAASGAKVARRALQKKEV
jgi:UDP-N-acetylmuramyl pentapeptide phosphotransferase/UDP-N-acetylglucosamine-1-phosphate transferase